MANTNGHATNPLTPSATLADLIREPLSHDFFAALRRLQAVLPGPAVGEADRPSEEWARIAQEASLAFAPTTISAATWDETRRKLQLMVRFTGLLGPNGPMPAHLTEYVIDRRRHHDDTALEAFLNVFNHRIFTLFFRAWALNQPTVDYDRPDERLHEFYLRCLLGLGAPGSSARDSVPEAARVYHSGWLTGLSRSPEGLAAILGDFLSLPVAVESFQGMWLELPADSQCRLGASPETGSLGTCCFAGERVWLVHLKFRLRLGPLSRRDYEKLIPGGVAFRQVADWVRYYLGEEFFWEMQLVLRRDEVPSCQLGSGVRLGWTTWIGAPAANRDVDDLVIQAA